MNHNQLDWLRNHGGSLVVATVAVAVAVVVVVVVVLVWVAVNGTSDRWRRSPRN